MKTLAEKIAVMQAAERGEAIEMKQLARDNSWTKINDVHKLLWHWGDFDYRVAQRAMEVCVCVYKTAEIRIPFVLTKEQYKNHWQKDKLELLAQHTITY